MARTINGNLTGRAAQIERAEMLENLYVNPFAAKFCEAVNALEEMIGSEAFEQWYDAPEFDGLSNGDMLLKMREKIRQLQTQPHPVEAAYQMEKVMDDEYPLTFSGGEVDEARPYKMNTASMEDDLPF